MMSSNRIFVNIAILIETLAAIIPAIVPTMIKIMLKISPGSVFKKIKRSK